MISIKYSDCWISATDDGLPTFVPSYWTQEIINGIQAAFEAGDYRVVPDLEPPPPEPDWAGFNLAMVPPVGESSFETWLSQFKEPYRVSVTQASVERNITELQRLYNNLKALAKPSPAQTAEWGVVAKKFNINLEF